MADRVVLSIGTKRGLFFLESDAKREKWNLRGPFVPGWSVYHAVVDARRAPTVHVAANSDFLGSTIFRGDWKKAKFDGAKKPPVPPKLLPAQMKILKQYGISSAARVWHVEPARPSEKDVLYAGTAPAGLFRSEDGGNTWAPVKGLLRHPSRPTWTPGAGGQCLHSIQLDPANARRMYVGISSAGVFRSDDDGATWKRINQDIPDLEGKPADPDAGT